MTISITTRLYVAERANEKCEYCRTLDQVSLHSFHVDHIIAIKHDGTDDMSNLAWSCLSCNLHKGSDVASYDRETGKLNPFFNPRNDKWDDHFVLSEYEIMGKIAIGRITCDSCK